MDTTTSLITFDPKNVQTLPTVMDIHEVLEYLPHRYPFLLIDKVIHLEAGKRIIALKNVTMNEPQFQGHFPHRPVMPGVLMIEAMAQAAEILSFKTEGTKPTPDKIYYFAGIDNARFKKPVQPADQLIFDIELLKVKAGIGKFMARAYVDGILAVEAELTCALKKVA
jgi:3-hydroxyacyl-[acyl-carrier-protein] dehydratase